MAPRSLLLAAALAVSSGCLRVRLPEARMLPGAAQNAFTWERAVELALAHHPDLRKARATLEAQAHARNVALGAYLPSATGSLSRKLARTTTSTSTDSLALGLDVEQPLFTGFQTTGKALRAWREWEAARWAYVEASADVRQTLRASFVELLRLQKLLEVDQRIAARRQDNADLIRLRYEAGREHIGSSLRARAIAEQAAFEVRQTQRRIESQSLAFGRQLGGFFMVPAFVAGDLERMVPAEPAPPGDYTTIAGRTPAVERLTRSAEALKASILSAQSALWPTATGNVNYGYSGSRASNLKDEASVGLTVSVPLFKGGRNVEGVLESNAEYRAAAEAARSARDQHLAELADRWNAFRDAWEFVAVRSAFLEAARKRSEIVRTQYTTGLSSFQEFDIAEQELADAENAYVQSLADVLLKEANWAQAQGVTLEDTQHAR